MDYGNIITSVVIPLVSVLGTVLYIRRSKKAEVKAKEIENEKSDIDNADAMIELVKKANAEAGKVQQDLINDLKKENEKFKNTVCRLERAFDAIRLCDHRDGCPVYPELQKLRSSHGDENRDAGSKG